MVVRDNQEKVLGRDLKRARQAADVGDAKSNDVTKDAATFFG